MSLCRTGLMLKTMKPFRSAAGCWSVRANHMQTVELVDPFLKVRILAKGPVGFLKRGCVWMQSWTSWDASSLLIPSSFNPRQLASYSGSGSVWGEPRMNSGSAQRQNSEVMHIGSQTASILFTMILLTGSCWVSSRASALLEPLNPNMVDLIHRISCPKCHITAGLVLTSS